MKSKRRVLIVRLGSMGDIIHALPVSATLKENFPTWDIDWLVESRWRPLLDGNPCLDRIVEVDTLRWRKQPFSPEAWNSFRSLLTSLRERRYDYSLDLQGAIKSAIACALAGAQNVIGFERPWVKEPVSAALYTHRIRSESTHIVDANLDLAASLGAARRMVQFPLPDGDAASLPEDLPQTFAVLNPGAGWRSKCWPPENCAELCDALHKDLDLPVVLNVGPDEEILARKVRDICRTANPRVYFGSLKGLIALLRRACLMVGPDTGPLHMAAALGIPTVGLFGPTDPGRNGPYGRCHTIVRAPAAATSYKHSSEEASEMRQIRPDDVLKAICDLLYSARAAAGQVRKDASTQVEVRR